MMLMLAASDALAQARQQFNLSTPAGMDVPMTPDRLLRLEQWVNAVAAHQPGERDDSTSTVNAWGLRELQGLWIDLNTLARVMRNRSAGGFTATTREGFVVRLLYTPAQLRAIATLACVAGGYLDPSGAAMPSGHPARQCVDSVPLNELSTELREAALRFGRARAARGDDNMVFERAALLHSDIAMLERPMAIPVSTPSLPVGPRRIQLEMMDGNPVSMTLAGLHWEMAETALEYVQPADATRPAPSRDPFVRQWYTATATWMQKEERHDAQHLDNARRLFPDDAVLLFLSGCEHEAYASPAIQAPLQAARRMPGSPGSSTEEWRRADALFRDAMRADPDAMEVRLHRGRILSLLGAQDDAVAELERARMALSDPQQRYYAEVFLGRALEDRGDFAEAQQAYARAHDLAPGAQTPLLALSQLARRRDDFEGARSAIEELAHLADTSDDSDPWWFYFVSHAQHADALVADAWAMVRYGW